MISYTGVLPRTSYLPRYDGLAVGNTPMLALDAKKTKKIRA